MTEIGRGGRRVWKEERQKEWVTEPSTHEYTPTGLTGSLPACPDKRIPGPGPAHGAGRNRCAGGPADRVLLARSRIAFFGARVLNRADGVLFGDGKVLGGALFRRAPEFVYPRQLFVRVEHRRKGGNRAAPRWLRQHARPDAPLVRIDVLVGNEGAITFWRTVRFGDDRLTVEWNR